MDGKRYSSGSDSRVTAVLNRRGLVTASGSLGERLFCGTKKTTTTDDRTTVLVPTICVLVVLFLGFKNGKKEKKE